MYLKPLPSRRWLRHHCNLTRSTLGVCTARAPRARCLVSVRRVSGAACRPYRQILSFDDAGRCVTAGRSWHETAMSGQIEIKAGTQVRHTEHTQKPHRYWCGEPTRPARLRIRHEGSQVSFAAGYEVVIGRDLYADLRIPDPRISRAHLILRFDQGRWLAIDNGSLKRHLRQRLPNAGDRPAMTARAFTSGIPPGRG